MILCQQLSEEYRCLLVQFSLTVWVVCHLPWHLTQHKVPLKLATCCVLSFPPDGSIAFQTGISSDTGAEKRPRAQNTNQVIPKTDRNVFSVQAQIKQCFLFSIIICQSTWKAVRKLWGTNFSFIPISHFSIVIMLPCLFFPIYKTFPNLITLPFIKPKIDTSKSRANFSISSFQ